MAKAAQARRRDDADNAGLAQRVDAFKASILSPERTQELRRLIPRHVSADRFERNLVYAMEKEPRLLNQEPSLVFQEVAKLTALGFLLDPHLGEAYIIVAWNSKKQCEVPQARIGYLGLMKLAKQSDTIARIYASEVCQHDVWEESRGDNKRLRHDVDTWGDRGPIVGYYAHVTYKSGVTDFETMTLADIHGIRDRSDGWKAFQAKKISTTPWATDPGEMGKKTPIRRLAKRLPKTPDLAAAMKIEDRAEFSDLHDSAPRARLIAPPSDKQRAVTHQPQETVNVDARPTEEREPVPAGKQASDAPQKREAKDSPSFFDTDIWLKDIEGRYAAAKTRAEVDAIWPDHVSPRLDDVLQSDVDLVGRYRDAAAKRVKADV